MKRILQAHQEQISFLLVALFCVTAPLKNNFNSLSIILLSVFALLVLVINKHFDKKLFLKFTPLILFFVLTLFSTFYSEDIETALKLVSRLLPFILFPFVFSIIHLKRPHYEKVLKIYVFWMLAVCLYSHSQVLIKLYNNNDVLFNLFNNHYSYMSLANDTTDMHTTYYSYYVIVAIVFLMFFLFKESRFKIKVLYLVLLAYFTFFVFHVSARTPIFVLFLFYNFSILYYFFQKKKIKQGVFVLLLFYFISSIAIYNVRITRYRFQHLFGFTYAGGIHHDDGIDKLKQWKASIAANNNLLFGNGIGDANNDIFSSYLDYDLKKYADREYNAHNQFIQTYVALGLLGVIVLLFLFFYYFHLFYKSKQFMPVILLILMFILYQTETYLQRHHGIVMFCFLVCLFMNMGRNLKKIDG